MDTSLVTVLLYLAVGQGGPGYYVPGTRVDDGSQLTPQATAAKAIAERPDAAMPGYLLLTNKKVISGLIIRDGADFLVKRQGGVIPKKAHEVLAAGETMEDLYEFQNRAIPEFDIHERMNLYHWCLKEGLQDGAREQLETIIRIDPTNEHVQTLLRRFDKSAEPVVEAPVAPRGPVINPAAADPRRYLATFKDNDPEAFVQYTNNLEKMLINRCGHCHANTRHPSNFRLYSGAGRLGQRETARNLDSVLAHIDMANPNNSPILHYSIQAHGALKLPALGGPNDPLFQDLKDWVYRVARRTTTDVRPIARGERMDGPAAPWSAPEGDPDAAAFADNRFETAPRLRSGTNPQLPPGASRPVLPERTPPADPNVTAARGLPPSGWPAAEPNIQQTNFDPTMPADSPPRGPAESRPAAPNRPTSSQPTADDPWLPPATMPGRPAGAGKAAVPVDDPFDPSQFNRGRAPASTAGAGPRNANAPPTLNAGPGGSPYAGRGPEAQESKVGMLGANESGVSSAAMRRPSAADSAPPPAQPESAPTFPTPVAPGRPGLPFGRLFGK